MDIDPDIANWIMEFLLKQPIEDRTLNSLLRILPLPNNNLNLEKLLLLKKLESELSRSSSSESMLDLLEQLEEIEFRQGNESVSDAMKHAYCAVAVECTVKILAIGDDGDGSSKFKFFESVKRLWRGRIGRMQKVVEKGGLGSEELSMWEDAMEDAVWDDSICESVVNKCKGLSAVDAVSDYLMEERKRMGPAFLELVAAKVKDDEVAKEILGVGTTDVVVAVGEAPSPSHCVDWNMDVGNAGNEIPKGRIPLREKLIGLKHSRRHRSRNPQRAKIVDSDEVAVGLSHMNHNSPPSEEVNRVREALESSAVDLLAVVKDPLPDALQLAETISVTPRENKQHDPVKENHVECNRIVQAAFDVSNVHKPSLMERNNSAHTCEWSESIDEPEENEASRCKLMLPTPRTINIDPLNRYEINNVQKRRKRRYWSVVEEDALRAGVKKFGKGNWKAILTEYRDIFDERTDGDLKDKWRNMTKCGGTS